MHWNQTKDDIAVSTSVIKLDEFDIQQGARKLHINLSNTGNYALNSFRIDILPQNKGMWFPIASDSASFAADIEYPIEMVNIDTGTDITTLGSDCSAWIDLEILGMERARIYASSVSDTTINVRWQTR